MKQTIASVFFNIQAPTLENNVFKLVLNFEFNFVKIGRLCHIAAIGTIGKLVGKIV